VTARDVLERPFPPDLVRRRPGRSGEAIVYLEGHVVIARLNEAFAGDWSFTIQSHQILDDEVIVLGKLAAGGNEKSAFGSSVITRPRDGGQPISLGDDLKAATTDSVKKCATLLGVGLHLHAQADPTPRPARKVEAAPASAPAPRDNRLLSSAQLRALHAIRRRLGWTEAELNSYARSKAGIEDVEQLDKRTASALIEALQAQETPTGARR
jgi:hypothetical protein